MRKAEDAALNGNNVELMVKLKEELSSLLVKEEKNVASAVKNSLDEIK